MIRQALRTNPTRAPRVSGATVPAPVGGWDAVSPLSEMRPDRAIVLDNFIPREGYVELRKGWTSWATTGETTAVETLMAYQAPNPVNDKLFACVNGKVFNVTASGSAGAAVVSSLTNSRLQHTMFTTTGGQFLYFVNGANAPRCFDGSTWATPTITGATASDFVAVTSFKNRLLFAANNKLGFYYLPVDAYQGAASFFELGAVFTKGGYLMAIGTWTLDGGSGVDDHAVFVSSRGQVAIYKGTDPASAGTWSLVGVFNNAAPLGRRCLIKTGPDLAVVTVEGVVPLSKSLALDVGAVRANSVTANIARAMSDAARTYGSNFGWQFTVYPRGTMALLNVPVQEGVTQHQYVANTVTGAWCRFTGINANCWEVFNDTLYFGGNSGYVGKADTGPNDNGTAITADLKTAFNYFGARGTLKRFPMIQPVIVSDGVATPAILVNTDFRDETPTSPGATTTSGALLWDAFYWDVDYWPVDVTVSQAWASSAAVGQCAAIRMRIVANSTSSNAILLQVNSFNVTLERGGFL